MGVVVTDGKVAAILKGSMKDVEKATRALATLEKKISSLKIETVPLPEVAGVRVELRFKGDMEEFESINKELEILKKTAAFDTVPLTGNEFIGTWPTPEKLKKHIYWTIGVTTKARKTKS